jgi:hypothetical protein
MDYGYYMGKARKSIKKLNPRQKFFTSDLFDKKEWFDLGCGNQQNFGKHFINEVRQKKVADVICLNDGKSGRNRYIYKG